MITFNGVTSDSLGIIVDGYSSKPIAKRRVESQHIPGRNGDLLIDEGVYDNYTQSYTIYWLPTTSPSSVSAWLNQSGYFKLVDSDGQKGYVQLLPQNAGIAIGSTSTLSLTVNPSGNVLIGTTTDNGYKLQVNGSERVYGDLIVDGEVSALVA